MKSAIWIFIVLNILILVSVISYVILKYPELPEIIPTHFGSGGVADGFGNKNMIWLEVGINVAIYALLTYLSNKPQYFNMPDEMKANTPLIKLFAHVMCFVLMILFANLTYETIEVALGNAVKLSSNMWLFLGLLFLVLIGFLAYSSYSTPQKKSV